MTKGRKPKGDAQRRGGHKPAQERPAQVLEASVVGQATLPMPMAVAGNPIMAECWKNLVGPGKGFAEQDVPLLESYCYWYAVFCQASQNTITPDGRVVTMYAKKDAAGRTDPSSVKANPDLKTAEKATEMLRKLGDALNISPTARVRSGLMQAMTASTVEDLARRTSEGYAKFKADKARKALPGA